MKLKLKEIAEKLGKNATDIAKDTGINRNTINSLMRGKVSDLRVSTLEKIAKAYGLSLGDLFEEEPLKKGHAATKAQGPSRKFYKQEGELVPFTTWPWVASAGDFKIVHEGKDIRFGQLDIYFKKDYSFVYWDLAKLRDLANIFYELYGKQKEKYAKLYGKYSVRASEIEDIYLNIHNEHPGKISTGELKITFKKLQAAYEGFWNDSLFIDAFDTGVDRELINDIAQQHALDKREVEILTTPVEMTFADEQRQALLSLLKGFRGKGKGDVSVFLKKHGAALEEYRRKFDYYKSNYVHIKHITTQEIASEAEKYLKDVGLLKKDHERLDQYAENKQKEIRVILKAHHLTENPLWFFANITFWREHRKKINLMGIHALDFILSALEEKTGMQKKFLRYLTFDEVDNVLKGLIPASTLEQRYRDGLLISMTEDGYKIFEGPEADSIKDDIEMTLIKGEAKSGGESKVISGQTASQGYAKGVARIVLTQEDFGKFKSGEVLVTSMTRPEFVPLMKIAAAIVTNEGGITCHAAIVSRELGKPCVIATKIATQVIKDGDVVEVRANHGTVRILK